MRTKWFVGAALLAATVAITGCEINAIADAGQSQRNGTVQGTGGNTPSGCNISNIAISGVGVGGSSVPWQINETRQFTGTFTANPPNCASAGDFKYTSSAPSVISIDEVTGQATARAAGQATICFEHRTVSSIRACTLQTVNGPTNPGITFTPTGPISLFPNSCPSAGPTMAVIMANMSVNWSSSNSAIASVSPSSGTQTTVTALTAGTVTITATGPQGQTGTVTVNVLQCPPPPPAGSVSFNPPSLCISGVSAVSFQIVPSNIGNATLDVSTSQAGLVTLSGSGLNWTATGVAAGNGSVIVRANNVIVGTLPVRVLPAGQSCGSSTIDYSPPGGTLVNQTQQLSATCVLGTGSTTCNPFWFSNHPELIAVNGNNTIVIAGVTWRVGLTATLSRTAPSNGTPTKISVQWSVTEVTPSASHDWF